MTKYSGECYCGVVKFYCDGDPFFTQYCHCNKCREIASQSKRDIINFDDSLPKFKDAPKEQFGSGELWNEDDAK